VDGRQQSGCAAGAWPNASVFRFSTNDYAPQDRLAAWHEIYGRIMCRQNIEPDDPQSIHTDVVFRKLPRLGIMTGYRSPALYRRERPQADSDNLFVTIALSGRFEAMQLGSEVCMEPGDAFVGAGAEPVSARVSEGYRSVTLSVPLAAMSPMVANLDTLFGRRVAASPALRLLTRYLDVLEETDDEAALQQTAVTHVHELLALALGTAREADEAARLGGVRAARLRAIKADIESNLGCDGLSVAAVAARHRLPLRYVQRLFEVDGVTFTAFVLERRLAHAHRLLNDPRRDGQPIGVIAFESGFTNHTYFARAFRNRFGATPSEVRAQARQAS
jgi:AraC-like DNA-binding protein